MLASMFITETPFPLYEHRVHQARYSMYEVLILPYRFCQNNAEKTHLLSHWRWHLYQWVVDNLKAEGELKAKKLVEREKMKPWKRQRYVEKVVERWEGDKKIDGLYRDYKTSVESLIEDKQAGGRWGSR